MAFTTSTYSPGKGNLHTLASLSLAFINIIDGSGSF